MARLCAESSSSLPLELVEEEILCRTPIESLVRFKSTCKDWYALFNSKRFIYKHLHLSAEKRRFIRVFRDMVQIMNPVTLNLLSLPLPAEFPRQSILIIHCDGLLLCRFAYERGGYKLGDKLAVWNPVLSRFKWIELLNDGNKSFSCTYGFGYDNNNKYKILKFDNYKGREYEIYDLESKLSTCFPATFDWSPILPSQHVSMKGNMYWIVKTKNTDKAFIQSFDFSTDTFKPICSSIPVNLSYEIVHDFDSFRIIKQDFVALSDFGGDRLSLLHQHKVEIKIEMWVTNKVSDGLVSWTKYFNVPHPQLPRLLHDGLSIGNPSYFIHKTNGIMLWCDDFSQEEYNNFARARFYEIGEGEIIKQVETGPQFWSNRGNNPCICGSVYVPSLVPVP